MRTIIVLALVLAGCTKPNPNRCCVDEADCAAADLPAGMTCDEGLVCRANNCVAEVCDSNAACDLLAPYCTNPPDGLCQATCTADTQCPGTGQPATSTHCEGGACVQCRGASDCTAGEPVCSAGVCVACTAHEQCASSVCKDDGQCAPANEVAYVDLLGTPGSDCTAIAPCSTIERALTFEGMRPYIVINTGTYTRTGPLTLRNANWLIGRGSPRPILDRMDSGPILGVTGIANLHIDNIELTGATGDVTNGEANGGHAIYCATIGNTPRVDVRRSYIHDVDSSGVFTRGCSVSVRQSVFTKAGLDIYDSSATIDGNTVMAARVNLDSGLFTVTNNIIARNASNGLEMYLPGTGNVISYNTIVDAGVLCQAPTAQAFPNNIFARTGNLPTAAGCTFPSSIVAPTDVSALKFKHPDSPPYDYHLMTGSSAIDAAMGTSSLDHDIDGDKRPQGAARDVGADEAQ